MSGPRHTTQRQAILRTVKVSPQPVSAEDVWAKLTRPPHRVGQATVYRNLEWLSRRGEIYRFTDEIGVTRYVGHVAHLGDFHCQRCGREWPLPVDMMANTLDALAQPFGQAGFVRLQVTGLCRECLSLAKL